MSSPAPAAIATPPGDAHSSDAPLIGLAFAASLLLVWLVSRQGLVVAGFAGGLLALGGLAYALRPRAPALAADEWALPDWSVTLSAIESGAAIGTGTGADAGLAITDRAGRMVCANRRFQQWFGTAQAPPRLPLDAASLEGLAQAARIAWRDGAGQAQVLTDGSGRWSATLTRAGRAEDYLIWRFAALHHADPIDEIAGHLAGKLGRALSQAGFAAALVNADGTIRAASAGFAERALGESARGEAAQPATGRQFVSLLSQDEEDRLYWARDSRHAAPVTLFYLPLADPDVAGDADPQTIPSLMLLADAGIGIGGEGNMPSAARHLEGLLGQLPLGLAMADRDGRLIFANAAFLRAAGRADQPTPSWPTDLVVREDKAALSDALRTYGKGSARSGDVTVRLVAQPDEPVSLSLAGVRGLGEAAVLLSLADSTEEARLKRQVAQATKMQAVGQLAGGVAHDFNNVLTAILGLCDLMLLRHTPGDSDYDDIQQIRANSNRAASLTRQLLAFSRQQTLRPVVLQLPDIVSDISQMLKRLIGERIQLTVSHDRELGPVRADPTQLEQVIVNLVVNARDAIHGTGSGTGLAAPGEGAGRITLATRRVTAADVRAQRSDILPVADYTALIVEDSGSGITAENLAKIFEPFFTTKEQGKGGQMGGTGLGLSTVYGIVKQSGGFIFADSEPGKGTRISIYLPVHHGAPVPARAEPVEARSQWSGGGDLLLVEDEDTVRIVAQRALTRAGYAVTLARDGEEGLDEVKARLAAGSGMFDLVISDVVMPGMDGPAMARAIRALVPDLPVLFMSGHAEEQLRRELEIGNASFIAKPFSVQAISDKVAGVIGAGK